jgi:hypothetical protein
VFRETHETEEVSQAVLREAHGIKGKSEAMLGYAKL